MIYKEDKHYEEPCGRGNIGEVVFNCQENLRISAFFSIMCNLNSELQKRKTYVEINETLKVVSEIDVLNHYNLRKTKEQTCTAVSWWSREIVMWQKFYILNVMWQSFTF